MRELAKRWGLSFRKERQVEGEIAKGSFKRADGEEVNIYLLLPMTYMNLSGVAVRKAINYYKIPWNPLEAPGSLVVVVDDVDLPFGAFRLRSHGSTGGHKGLKSIQEHLQTQDYPRLRMGIGSHSADNSAYRPPLEDYVLGKFVQEEENTLPEFIAHAVEVIECWLKEGSQKAIQAINLLRSKKKEDE